MRIFLSLVSVGVLVLSYSQAGALACKDIPGARIDPDLNVLSTSFGRLLPDRREITDQRQESETISFRRIVATRIQTDDGKATADLLLGNDDSTFVSASINGKSLKQTTPTKLAGLGFTESVDKITMALAKINQPAKAFVTPQIGTQVTLKDLSKARPEVSAGQHNIKISGTPKTEKTTNIMYTCTSDAEFAGDPTILNTMVVLRGVLKATTITRITTINRSLNIKIADIATLQTVTANQFQKILATVPEIAKLFTIAQTDKVVTPPPLPRVPAIEQGTQPVQPGAQAARPTATKSSPFLTELIDFFSLSKPGTWVLLFFAMLISGLGFLGSRRGRENTDVTPGEKPDIQSDQPTITESTTPIDQLTAMSEVAKANQQQQNQLTESLEKADAESTVKEALNEQIAPLKQEIEKATQEARQLREKNLELKLRLDEAENQSREFSTQIIELKTSSTLMESRLTADERSVIELEKANQQLMGVNQGYRENIKEVEAEYTAQMHKLNLREDALSHAERLNNEMLRFNEEINQAFTEEKAARISLEAELGRLSQDYNELWTKSSERVARFREDNATQKVRIREMRDDLISLESELHLTRKDRDDLNREFAILSNEKIRISNEHKSAINLLESKVEQLHLDLTALRRVLAENQVPIPDMSRLTTSGRHQTTLQNHEAGRRMIRQENETQDNVVPLSRQKFDRRK